MNYSLDISEVLDNKFAKLAKKNKKQLRILDKNKEFIELTDEAKKLARDYINDGNISEKYIVDAQHISIATVYKVDVVVSWNFKHMVNLEKIRIYNSINMRYGYPQIEIRSPREVLREE